MTVDLEELRSALTGDVLEPADREYERARLCFNLLVDRRPTAIARCLDAKDVANALAFAQANDLEIAVRGGGHNPAGHCAVDDGLVIDLSRMRNVEVDPGERRRGLRGRRDLARLRRRDPGTRPGHSRRRGRLDRRHRPHPRRRDRPPHRPARPHLRQPDRRRAGHAGGRGHPRRARRRTPSCSGACAAEAATSASSRGRSFRLHRLERVVGGRLDYEGDAVRDALRAFRDVDAQAGNEISIQCQISTNEDLTPDPGRRPLLRRAARAEEIARAALGAGARRRRRARARLPRPAARSSTPATASTATTGRATSSASCPTS